MESSCDEKMAQASVQTNLERNVDPLVFLNGGCCSYGGSVDSQVAVFGELLRQISPLLSEKPEDILWFFVSMEEIYKVGLVIDCVFIMRILPLVSGRLLSFFGECLSATCSWAECKAQFWGEYFPYIVKERLYMYIYLIFWMICLLVIY
jgi:hypothetical protein